MKKGRVANFHGQASDAYAYVWMVQGSLFSWSTSWLLFHEMKKDRVANFHGQASDAYAYVGTVHNNVHIYSKEIRRLSYNKQ
jgi:hypothetical protein